MTELDFDELDKAVNSLMGGVPEKDKGAIGPSNKTLDINTTLAPNETPAYANLSQAASSIGSEAIDKQEHTVSLTSPVPAPPSPRAIPVTPTTPAVPSRSGRFMDVVHPSSDMRTSSVRSVSRQGVTIAAPSPAPISIPRQSPEVATTTPTEAPSAPAPEPPIVQAPAAPAPVGNLPTSEEPVPDFTTDGETPSLAESPATGVEPLTSPFLADAKVEKRPLGGAAVADEAEKDTVAVEPTPTSTLAAPDTSKPSEDDEPENESSTSPAVGRLDEITVHIPEEYKDELLAVEKSSPTEVELAEPLPEQPSAPLGGPASIPQQYRETPSTGDATNGSIYDTSAYHQPLAHPAKKSSGWFWVLVIVVLILLGAAAGAAVYFLGK